MRRATSILLGLLVAIGAIVPLVEHSHAALVQSDVACAADHHQSAEVAAQSSQHVRAGDVHVHDCAACQQHRVRSLAVDLAQTHSDQDPVFWLGLTPVEPESPGVSGVRLARGPPLRS